LTEVTRSPYDEVMLTELMFDFKDIVVYEISSSILVAEEEQSSHRGHFRCYIDNTTKEFFVEVACVDMMKALNRSTLMNILKLAEEAGAETAYVCLRKTIGNKVQYLKNFLFVGFEQLGVEEQKEISMTRTHTLLKYSIVNNEEL